jgi:hypothetical protein
MPGATRIVICEEVFDYKVGGDQIAVVHPLSKLTFTVKAPGSAPDYRSMSIEAHSRAYDKYITAVKKTIWNRFTELQSARR